MQARDNKSNAAEPPTAAVERAGAQDELAEPGDVGACGGLHDAGAQVVGGSQEQIDHSDRYATADERDDEALHGPGQATGLASKDALDDLDGEQTDGDHSGDRGGDAELQVETRSAEVHRRRRAHLAPQPAHGVVRRLAERLGDGVEGVARGGLGGVAGALAVGGRVVPLTGHLDYTVQSETSTVPYPSRQRPEPTWTTREKRLVVETLLPVIVSTPETSSTAARMSGGCQPASIICCHCGSS